MVAPSWYWSWNSGYLPFEDQQQAAAATNACNNRRRRWRSEYILRGGEHVCVCTYILLAAGIRYLKSMPELHGPPVLLLRWLPGCGCCWVYSLAGEKKKEPILMSYFGMNDFWWIKFISFFFRKLKVYAKINQLLAFYKKFKTCIDLMNALLRWFFFHADTLLGTTKGKAKLHLLRILEIIRWWM